MEEISNLKKEITRLKDSVTEKEVEINRFRSMYEETNTELKNFQIEKMKKSKLLIENKMNGDKFMQLYKDSKEQNKLLQEERIKLMEMIKSKDQVKFEEVSNVNQMYTEARKECDRLLEVNSKLTTDTVKLRTALATIEQRFED